MNHLQNTSSGNVEQAATCSGFRLFQVLEQAGSLFYMIDPLENTIISLPAIEGGQSREIKKQKLSRGTNRF